MTEKSKAFWRGFWKGASLEFLWKDSPLLQGAIGGLAIVVFLILVAPPMLAFAEFWFGLWK